MDDFSPATVLASAGISAVVSALVALFATSKTKVRQMRAERAENARLRVAAIAQDLRRKLRVYSDSQRPEPRRQPDLYHADDHRVATEVLAAAEGLGSVRAWLVNRRCRAIFGRFTTELAEDRPYDGSSMGSMFAPILSAQWRRMDEESGDLATGYLYSEAYRTPPGHRSQAALRRQLVLLSRCL